MDITFSSLVSSANSIAILLPLRINLDQAAAALSLYLSLKGEKDVSISSASEMTVEFNRLVGVDKISKELGNKNLSIRFKNYPAESIERVSADVDGQEFKLTIIPKTGFVSPQKDQVELLFSGVSADLVILVGGSNEVDFPVLQSEDLKDAKIVNIGIFPFTAPQGKEIMSFFLPLSSYSELATILIKEGNLNLDEDTATNLITGIEEGSKNFTKDSVNADTFEIVAHLLRSGGRRRQGGQIKKDYPKGSIPGENLRIEKTEKKKEVINTNKQDEIPIQAPKDWFEPKIYKGTSVC